MVRRSLGVALWTVVGLLACVLGAGRALVGTGAGRALLARVLEGTLTALFTGTVAVGHVEGSLLTGLTLSDVRLFDADTTLVAWLPRAAVSYNPFDFAAGRVVLFEFDLERPVINIVQHRNGRLNVEELLRLGGAGPDTGSHGPATLILFRNVRIEDGTVVLRLQDQASAGDTSLEIERGGPNGRLRIRRFEHLDAYLAALRVSSPREKGIRIDVSQLAVTSTDPAVRLVDVAGRLTVVGDSLDADLSRVRLPASRLSARGHIRWPHDTLLFDLAVRVDSATLRDFHFINPRFPESGVLAGRVALRSHGGRLLEVRLDPFRLAYRDGTLTGRLTAVTAADSGPVAVRGADLEAQDFDLEFVRLFLDTLPFAGRLSGHTVASGPLAALALEADWAFRDSLVAGWPQTRIRGKGEVGLVAPDGIRFQPFTLEAAMVDLGTVRRLAPAVTLRGELVAAGTLSGPLKNAQFSGTLGQRDGARPESRITGVVRLDGRSDTLGIFADVVAESLSFDGLKGSFPGLPLRGAVAGPIRLSGTLASLETRAELRSAGGAVNINGLLQLDVPHYGARGFTVRAQDLDLGRWLEQGPESRLSFTVGGDITGDSATPPVGAVTATLAPSLLVGTTLDSGVARLRFADQRFYVDSLRIAQPGLISTGTGSLGWTRAVHGVLTLDFDADSLDSLDSLVSWLAGQDVAGGSGPGRALGGAARVLLTLEGALDSLGFDARASGEHLRWREWDVPAGRAGLVYRPGPRGGPGGGPFALTVTLDSLRYGDLGFGGVSAAARGMVDSLTWFARARVGEGAAFLAGGRFARRDDAVRGAVASVGLDSLAVQLPGDVWVLKRPSEVVINDSTAAMRGIVLESAYGPGRLVLEGDFPTGGRGNVHLQLEAFPLAGVYALLERDTSGIGGTITATARLGGTRADPVATGSFSLTNGSFGDFRTPFVDGAFDYRQRRLEGAMHLWRGGQQIVNLTAYLPLDLSLTTVARRELPDTLSVRAVADSVDLSVLEALTLALREVRGVFSADVGIAGTWDAPRLRGELEIAGAEATIPALNVRYQDVNGRLALSGDTVAIRSLSARSEKGRADVAGVVHLERLTRPVLDLTIAADQFKALDLKSNVTITARGRLGLAGPVFGATLTGRATVTSGVLYFADLVKKRIVNLDELVDTALTSLIQQQRLGPEFHTVFLDSLRIDELELTMGSDVWLRSDEANIQLVGTARLTKRGSAFLVSGTLQATRGTYRLKVGPVTREFVVTQGTVRYFGTPDQNAELDIEAKHTVHPVPTPSQRNPEDITVVAHITGTLLVPRVTLEAEKQDLSQTELISFLLFGKPSFELGGDQGGIADQRALLQSAASVLSGELERTIVSDLGVPIDYVEIRPGGGSQADPFSGFRFAVGRQVGPKTFIVVNAGFCEGRQIAVSNTLGLSLQFRISPEWRTEASFEPVRTCADPVTESQIGTVRRQIGLDLFWEKRY